jgi:hypothetical protein
MNHSRGNVCRLVLLSMLLLRALLLPSETSAATSTKTVKSSTKSSAKPGNAKPTKAKVRARGKRKSIDFNAPGIAAFQKKNFSEALRLFGVATKNDPKNPLTWLYHGRAIVAVFGANDPENYCDDDKNWIFDALASLSRAMDLGAPKVLPILGSIKDANFQKFRTRPEFKNWELARTLPLKTSIATQDFFAKHNDWLIENGPNPATVVTFAPTHELTIAASDGVRDTGTWSAGADRVVIKTKNEMRTLNLITSKRVFGSAKKSFHTVVLKDPSTAQAWELGPEIADCPKP